MTRSEHPNPPEWVHCNQCLRSTRHDLIATRIVREPEELTDYDSGAVEYLFTWETTYSVLECRGCGGITLRRRLTADGPSVDETMYYPPPVSRQTPQWQYKLPNDLQTLLKESYVALQAGSKRLAIMGARSLVDLFMNSVLGDIGGFDRKLDALVDGGFISKQNRDVLESALEAGHAVVHRGHEPKTKDVNRVFDIVENMLQTLVLKEESEELRRNTPRRKKSNR